MQNAALQERLHAALADLPTDDLAAKLDAQMAETAIVRSEKAAYVKFRRFVWRV